MYINYLSFTQPLDNCSPKRIQLLRSEVVSFE